ncbi:DegV domain-containing protein [Muribaculaceae bacterium]|nr:DegV domain-containing protein [Lachnospiraceae bacterium]GFI56942.1 DegV domain-containing protein [Muribaculaceae bacterium]
MLKIITDSASDLPKEYITAHQLHVIPTPVVIDETDYFDGKTIQTKEFYNILDDTKRDVRTYHINPAMFEEAFTPYAQAGDSIIYLCFSTGIAGTFNAAHIAKENVLEQYPDFDLTIIDSKSASIGFGLLVSKLVTMLENGAPKEVLIEAADYFISHIHHVFTVHTLAYLIKGGRLSKFKGTIAETLDMKPILIVDKAGSLQVLKTVRGRKKSLKALIDYAKSNGYELSNQTLAFCHGEDNDALEFLLALADDELKPNNKLISTVGCAIGAHTGRGIVGLCFLDAGEDKYREYL